MAYRKRARTPLEQLFTDSEEEDSPTMLSVSTPRTDAEDEGPHPQERLRQKLFNDLLKALHGPSHKKYGSFVSCEAVKYSHSQGLLMKSFHVEGAGELQVPLCVEDISKLRCVCEKAECRKIDASKVTLLGAPEFMSNTVEPLARHAVRNLGRHGAAVPLEVTLDRLSLCETDDEDFTFRRDTGQEKGLFATLVLQIPTEDGYEGGGLVVQHKNSTKTFDCHLLSSVGFCYTVFYADCKQEWQKINRGTRVCLIFNLFRNDSFVHTLHRDFVASKVRDTEAALQPWLVDVMKGKWNIYSPKLAIPLTCKYAKDELFFDEVKGDDGFVLEVLKACRDENGKPLLDLHLCLVPDVECNEPVTHRFTSSGYRDLNSDYDHDGDDNSTGQCDRHYGDADQDNYYDSDGPYYHYHKDRTIHAARTVSAEPKIAFWAGEEDKLTMAFGNLGLDTREVVVGERAFYEEQNDKKCHKEYCLWPSRCSGWWYRAMLIVWPRELRFQCFVKRKFPLL